MSTTSLKMCPMAYAALLQHEGEWDKLKLAQFSLLAFPGAVIACPETKVCRLVLSSCKFGVTTWKMQVKKMRNEFYLVPRPREQVANDPGFFACITDPSKFRGLAVVPTPPNWTIAGNDRKMEANCLRLVTQAQGKGEDLQSFAARWGFRGHNATQLKWLFEVSGVAGRKPEKKTDFITALCKHFINDCTDDDVILAIERHNDTNLGDEFKSGSLLFQGDEGMDLVEDVQLEDDLEDMIQEEMADAERRAGERELQNRAVRRRLEEDQG